MMAPAAAIDVRRFETVRREWFAIMHPPRPDPVRFAEVKRQAGELIDTGRWTSGPADLLSVLGRHRDELTHSRIIGWLLTPTGRHGLGRGFLRSMLGAAWPGEGLLQSGPIIVDTEVVAAGLDNDGRLREARADIVVYGDGVTVIVENKLDAGEGLEQCERLYWAWASEPGESRWLFLTPTGRPPATTSSDVARSAWRTMSYSQLRDVLDTVLSKQEPTSTPGQASVLQYLWTLKGAAAT